jgi:hypothetical protein
MGFSVNGVETRSLTRHLDRNTLIALLIHLLTHSAANTEHCGRVVITPALYT